MTSSRWSRTSLSIVRMSSRKLNVSIPCSNGKVYMTDGKIIKAAETSMAGVEGYRKLGGRLVGIVA